MQHPQPIQESLETVGYTVLNNVFSKESIQALNDVIGQFNSEHTGSRPPTDLFAIRRLFKRVPGTAQLIFNDGFINLLSSVFGTGFFVTKSIFFDKPASSNWFVAWHQDLTISVDKKIHVDGFGPWTVKEEQFSVRPPLSVLENNFTVRIHLDSTDEKNGALKVIPGSHAEGIISPRTIPAYTVREKVCAVEQGGLMFMKPLLLHASGRSLYPLRRRVIHIEFSRVNLPVGIQWSEFMHFEK